MFYITGDTHIPIDIGKLNTKNFPQQKNLTKNDYVIICGDFGGVWNNKSEDLYWQKWLSERNFTTLFVDGNHENFHLLNNYEISNFHGGKVHKIENSVYHLMRGEVFNINGTNFFAMGGATSHDKINRTENISWWAEELPTDEEYKTAIENLEKHDWNVDYVISHCTCDSILNILSARYEHDKLTNFFESVIKEKLQFKKWFFGHYHENLTIYEKYICLYDRIVEI